MYTLQVNSDNPPIGSLIIANVINSRKNDTIRINWKKEWKTNDVVELKKNDTPLAQTCYEVGRYLSRTIDTNLYGGVNAHTRTEVDHWLSFAIRPLDIYPLDDSSLKYLDKTLMSTTWLVAKQLTIADIFVFCTLLRNELSDVHRKQYPHITRWYKQMLSLNETIEAVSCIEKNRTSPPTKRVSNKITTRPSKDEKKQEGKFIELPGAEMGKVVVRFPPEASGYLHIGHAKAALLNQYYANAFEGQLIMRFDDTNPDKEDVEFEKAILEDLNLLEIKADRFTHTSDYFDTMLNYCTKLITEGKAFVDDTPSDVMKQQRDKREPSTKRNNSIEDNLKLWKEMQNNTPQGRVCCVRAKIDYQSVNGCLRDPTIYRCKPEPHPRTGTKYKVYPTYDFACPIVDAIENVTHTLRTTEYQDRDSQFYWFIEALNLRRPHIWAYSRLNMTNTVLSKRKLTWLVSSGFVDGWDDPRFPTVRGIIRRGMTVEGLRQFIIAQGSSRSVVFMEWDKIWAFNKKVIDPIATRHIALNRDELIPVEVVDAKSESLSVQNHPKDPSKGFKTVTVGSKLLIEKKDAEVLIEGQNTTFINWGNLFVEKIERIDGVVVKVIARPNVEDKNFKNTLKITWLDDSGDENNLVPCFGVYFDHILSKGILGKDEDFKDFVAKDTRYEVEMLGEMALKNVKKGEIVQLQRKGFFRCDVPYGPVSPFSSQEQPVILFHIPDGHVTSTGLVQKSNTSMKSSVVKSENLDGSKDLVGLDEQIRKQGDRIRDLKSSKAEKKMIEPEVKILLSLKTEYKNKSGREWKPEDLTKPDTKDELSRRIQKQGDKVRDLKSSKAEKKIVESEVKILLSLKAEYKNATGQDWKPEDLTKTLTAKTDIKDGLSEKIQKQGDKVRDLKSSKAEKKVIEPEVKILLSLKADYKKATGQDWKPEDLAKPPQTGVKDELSEKIQKQGDKIRDLKSSKAEKKVIEPEVKILLSLKAEYKNATGQEWKPEDLTKPLTAKTDIKDGLSEKIQKQGDKIRDLKNSKADEKVIEPEVKILLSLKADYKKATGQDWKPEDLAKPPQTGVKDELSEKIQKQGDKIRDLKSSKADKKVIEPEVKVLLSLKADYNKATGQDWKPEDLAKPLPAKTDIKDGLSENIQKQGDKIRDLKSSKAEKKIIEPEVKILLSLKAEYKNATGEDWKPPQTGIKDVLSGKIKNQGDKIRDLKNSKADKKIIEPEVMILLSLKAEYKTAVGTDWKPENESEPEETLKKKKKPDPAKSKPKDQPKEIETIKTGTRLGMEAKKEENFFDWYTQVITKSGMIEYYDVSGCYILRPWSFAIWKIIKTYIDQEITKLGVQECYFPIFVTRSVLEKEKSHLDDFAPEVAWVTKCGDSDLAEPIAIRPTSETVMYPAYAKWLKSDTELPLKLNQWNNVVRWEFKDPKPFLRTREFLWQEGHTAFATKAEADEEVLVILDMYAKVYEEFMAVPVIKGRKTEKEKFAGSDYTTTIEAFIPTSGRAIQGATSHHLGQNFSKMFNIQIEGAGEGDEKTFVYQNSWGLTTRTVGVLIMVHGDDKGLVLPPKLASIQVIIVPCGITATTTEDMRNKLQLECEKLLKELSWGISFRVKADFRNNRTPGWKFNHWELKGVPVRLELGPKDLEKNQVTFVRRDNSKRTTADRSDVINSLSSLLVEIQKDMFERAKNQLDSHVKRMEDWKDFCKELNDKNLILAPFCGEPSCEDNIKAESAREDEGEPGTLSMGAKSLCIPFEQPKTTKPVEDMKCVHPACDKKAKFYTLFGRSY